MPPRILPFRPPCSSRRAPCWRSECCSVSAPLPRPGSDRSSDGTKCRGSLAFRFPRDVEWLFGEMDTGCATQCAQRVPPDHPSIRVRIDAGRCTRRERRGCSLLEHLLFRESKSRPSEASRLASAGATFGATPMRDHPDATVPKQSFRTCPKITGAWFASPAQPTPSAPKCNRRGGGGPNARTRGEPAQRRLHPCHVFAGQLLARPIPRHR